MTKRKTHIRSHGAQDRAVNESFVDTMGDMGLYGVVRGVWAPFSNQQKE